MKYEALHAGSAALVHVKQRKDDTDPRVCGTHLHPPDLFPPKDVRKKIFYFVF